MFDTEEEKHLCVALIVYLSILVSVFKTKGPKCRRNPQRLLMNMKHDNSEIKAGIYFRHFFSLSVHKEVLMDLK